MNNPEVLIYLVLILIFFFFNYIANKAIGGDSERSEGDPTHPGPIEPEEDPWDPLGERREQHTKEELEGPIRSEQRHHPNTPEERKDLGRPSTLEPEQKATMPGGEKRTTPEQRVREKSSSFPSDSKTQKAKPLEDYEQYQETDKHSSAAVEARIQQAAEEERDSRQGGYGSSYSRGSGTYVYIPERVQGIGDVTESGRKGRKKRKKPPFDPVKAVIYSEILKRPDF